MKAPLIVDALRARDPGAPAALYDTHGESLFRYCWFLLRNRDAAQVALRDALVVAESHIGQLHSPGMLRPWLYALARAECLRRQQSLGAAHDTVIARPDQPDADRRLIAWHAVMSLGADEREALELTIRHGMDIPTAALVMSMEPAELDGILSGARVHLEQALAGEILARHGVHGCPERAEALRGWAGELTVPLRERLVQHARSCEVCGRYLPRNVAATKVFSLLPVPVPPQAMRLRVMTCFSDPELVGYRMFVAARVTDFNQFGFPDDEAAPPPRQRRVTARAVWSGPAAAAVAVAVLVAAVFAISRLGGFTTAVQGVSSAAGSTTMGATPTVTGPSGTSPSGSPGRKPAGDAGTPGAVNLTTTQGTGGGPARLFLRASPPPAAQGQGPGPGPDRPPSPGSSSPGTGQPTPGQLQVSPSSLVLGTGSTGQLRLTASGGPVSWSASTSTSDIVLSSSGGTIAAGQTVVVTVDITRAQSTSGRGTITIGPGGATVAVSWSNPSPPPPPPSGSPSPTVSSPSPSPSPPPSHTPSPPPPPSSPAPTLPGGSPSSLPSAPDPAGRQPAHQPSITAMRSASRPITASGTAPSKAGTSLCGMSTVRSPAACAPCTSSSGRSPT
jgi:DNA-directed RNA polymerase specialized sigma24 family protein